MGRETRLFKSEEHKSRDEAVSLVRQLADKIEEGKVILRQGKEEVALQLPGNVVFEVQAEDEDKGAKGTQRSLKLEIKWFDTASEQGGSLELG
jgi:amphi-Trp domain-containing protein